MPFQAPPAAVAPHAPPAAQLAAAVAAEPGGIVTVRLDPAELGTVRLRLRRAADGTAALAVSADRPATLDLLRRHAADLAREFRDAGFPGLDLSFGDMSDRGGDRGRGPAAGQAPPPPGAAPVSPPASPSASPRPAHAAPRGAAPDPARGDAAAPAAMDLRL